MMQKEKILGHMDRTYDVEYRQNDGIFVYFQRSKSLAGFSVWNCLFWKLVVTIKCTYKRTAIFEKNARLIVSETFHFIGLMLVLRNSSLLSIYCSCKYPHVSTIYLKLLSKVYVKIFQLNKPVVCHFIERYFSFHANMVKYI